MVYGLIGGGVMCLAMLIVPSIYPLRDRRAHYMMAPAFIAGAVLIGVAGGVLAGVLAVGLYPACVAYLMMTGN